MFAYAAVAVSRRTKRVRLAVALATFLLALPWLVLLKANSAPHYSLSHAQAVRVAQADPALSRPLARSGWTRVRVIPLDGQQQQVTFLKGGRLIAVAAVGPGPHVSHLIVKHANIDSGSRIANSLPILIGLTLLFALATATAPLLSLENLDVLALVAFTPAIVLLNFGYVEPSVLIAYPALIYLAMRCMWRGLGPSHATKSRPLYACLTSSWPERRRVRVLVYLVTAAALVVAMVTVTSRGASDVAFAAVSGATDLLHGVLPYGHIPGFIVHGDTYPLLTYVVYLPAAAIWPITDAFGDPQGALVITTIAVLAAGAGLYRVAVGLARHLAHDAERCGSPRSWGLRTALAWLTFPPVILSASGGSNDPVLAASLVAALLLFQHRRLSALMIGVAAWVKVIPALALPLFLARNGRRAALEATTSMVALSAGLCAWMLALGGGGALSAMFHAMSFQLQRTSLESLWVGLGLGFLQPVAEAVLAAAVLTAAATVILEPAVRGDLRRVGALLAGILLLAQVTANYWTWAYLPWALVPVLVSLFAAPRRSPERENEEPNWTPLDASSAEKGLLTSV